MADILPTVAQSGGNAKVRKTLKMLEKIPKNGRAMLGLVVYPNLAMWRDLVV